jgi:hypothetical protein
MSRDDRLAKLENALGAGGDDARLCARCCETAEQYQAIMDATRKELAPRVALDAPEARCPECHNWNLRGALSFFHPTLEGRTRHLEEAQAALDEFLEACAWPYKGRSKRGEP